jgi:hypothetical protein
MTICIVGVVDGEDGLPLKVENHCILVLVAIDVFLKENDNLYCRCC